MSNIEKDSIDEPVSKAELMKEIDQKMERVMAFLKNQNLDAVLLTRVNNFSWITAGIADNHIVITSESGFASLLITREGKKYLVADNTEAPHLMEEDLKGLGYESKEYNWFDRSADRDPKLEVIRSMAKGQIGTDVPYGSLKLIDAEFAPLRYILTEPEIKKYRWVGQKTVEAVSATCKKIKQGMSEQEIETLVSNELMIRKLRPTVLLIGADERVMNYYHYPPSTKKLKQYAFINVCARRWGLVASVGRYVHFGPLPDPLKNSMNISANICARMQHASKPGVKASEIFEMTKKWYAEYGLPDQWKPIHVGGGIGYAEREWVTSSTSKEVLQDHQAFAWNPFTIGALSFDTFILFTDHIENITIDKDWPSIPIKIDNKIYQMPDILIR